MSEHMRRSAREQRSSRGGSGVVPIAVAAAIAGAVAGAAFMGLRTGLTESPTQGNVQAVSTDAQNADATTSGTAANATGAQGGTEANGQDASQNQNADSNGASAPMGNAFVNKDDDAAKTDDKAKDGESKDGDKAKDEESKDGEAKTDDKAKDEESKDGEAKADGEASTGDQAKDGSQDQTQTGGQKSSSTSGDENQSTSTGTTTGGGTSSAQGDSSESGAVADRKKDPLYDKSSGWIEAGSCATEYAATGSQTASTYKWDDDEAQVGLDKSSYPWAHFGDYVEVEYEGIVVTAQVVDCGYYGAGPAGIILNPGVYEEFGAVDSDDWGRRDVRYRFV